MKLSTKGRYGLRALVDIAEYSEKIPVSISAISQRQSITVRYLEQILPKLKRAGMIRSIRGAQGGYQMAKDPGEISVGDILRALEGDLTMVDCAELKGEENTCNSAKYCVTKSVWKKINDSIQQTVNSIYLKDLVEESKNIHQTENSSGSERS